MSEGIFWFLQRGAAGRPEMLNILAWEEFPSPQGQQCPSGESPPDSLAASQPLTLTCPWGPTHSSRLSYSRRQGPGFSWALKGTGLGLCTSHSQSWGSETQLPEFKSQHHRHVSLILSVPQLPPLENGNAYFLALLFKTLKSTSMFST